MPALAASGLTRIFGGKVAAVVDLGFDVRDREFMFLLGPSGAGKTTTLRMIAGLEQPDRGRIQLGGRDITGLSPRDRNVAMVYDKHSLYPHLSVFENMAYPLRLRRMPEAEMRKRIGEVAEILEIGKLLDRRPRELSGGQQQRVAIGRALVRRADLYLMDEPISHLDAKLRAHMRVEFKKLQKEFEATILYVSHDQLEAMTMGDRIVVIDRGHVQQIGSPRDIFDRPANLFVATFVGEPSMNILGGDLVAEGPAWRVHGAGFVVAVPAERVAEAGLARRGPRPVRLGIRPHRVALAGPEAADTNNLERGTVYAVETLGSETVFDVEIGGAIVRAVARTADLRQAPRRIGEAIAVRFDLASLYLFDAATGQTLVQPAPRLAA